MDTIAFERPAIHHEKSDVAADRVRQIGLGDQVAGSARRLEDLVEIGLVLGLDLENVLAARPLQRLQDDAVRVVFDEAADFLDASGNHRRRSDDLRKSWK